MGPTHVASMFAGALLAAAAGNANGTGYIPVTLKALIGMWSCTTVEEPRWTVVFKFARDGTGTRSILDRATHRVTFVQHFTYQVGRGELYRQSPGLAPLSHDINLHGSILEMDREQFRNDEGWHTPPTRDTYTCRRGGSKSAR